METKTVEVNGHELPLINYRGVWVFPFLGTYISGMGNPIAMQLYTIEDDSLEFYADITVNIPECTCNAGCQFIDTNNLELDILEWLEKNKFGECTGNFGKSGFSSYPEFNFAKGVNYLIYKKISDTIDW